MDIQDGPGHESVADDTGSANSSGDASQLEVVRLRAEVARLQSRLESVRSLEQDQRRLRVRSVAGGVMAVLTSVSIVAATVAVWVHEVLFDTEVFISTMSPVFSDPAVTGPLGDYLTEQTFDALQIEERVDRALTTADDFIDEQVRGLIDVDARIAGRLSDAVRPRFTDLTSPIVTAAEGSVSDAVQTYLQSEGFQETLVDLATQAHESAVALLRGDYEQLPDVVVDTRSVRLDLTPAIAEAIQELVERGVGIVGFEPPPRFRAEVATPQAAREWLSRTFDRELPPDFAQITVMSDDRLEELQTGLGAIDRLPWLLTLLSILLTVATIWLSPRRARAVVQLAMAVVTAGLVAWLLIERLQLAVVDAFAEPAGKEAARAVLASTLEGLRTVGLAILALALLVGAFAFVLGHQWHRSAARWLSGRSDAERGAPRLDQIVVAHYDGMKTAGVAAALALLLIAGISLLSVSLVGAGLALYLSGLVAVRDRAQTGAGENGEVPAEGPTDSANAVTRDA